MCQTFENHIQHPILGDQWVVLLGWNAEMVGTKSHDLYPHYAMPWWVSHGFTYHISPLWYKIPLLILIFHYLYLHFICIYRAVFTLFLPFFTPTAVSIGGLLPTSKGRWLLGEKRCQFSTCHLPVGPVPMALRTCCTQTRLGWECLTHKNMGNQLF